MNKVTTVNLGGNAFQIEEAGYAALQAYLDGAARRLGQNPDKDEILGDIEAGIADKFRGVLVPHKSVVSAKEVDQVIAEMGPVQDDTEQPADAAGPTTSASGSTASSAKAQPPPPPSPGAGARREDENSAGPARRLYRIPEGAMLAGVCNGIAAYFVVDPMMVRMIFALATFLFAILSIAFHWLILLPIIGYGVLAVALPVATTAAERAAARGDPATAQEYIRRAKQGYYDSVKAFGGGPGKKHWKREFRREMRARAYRFSQGAVDWNAPGGFRPAAPAFALPVLGLLEFVIVILAIWAVTMLVTQGNVWGIPLPEGVPLWIGVVFLIFFFHVVSWPIKAARHALRASFGGGRACWQPGFADSLVWLAVLIAGIWLADHYVPAVHEFIVALPARMTELSEAVQRWWQGVH